MIILGLGSNVGDRLKTLRQTLALLKELPHFSVKQVSPLYLSNAWLPDHAPRDWNKPYLNLALRCETTLEPLLLLEKIKHLEKIYPTGFKTKRLYHFSRSLAVYHSFYH